MNGPKYYHDYGINDNKYYMSIRLFKFKMTKNSKIVFSSQICNDIITVCLASRKILEFHIEI